MSLDPVPDGSPLPMPTDDEVFWFLGWCWDVSHGLTLAAGTPTTLLPVAPLAGIAPLIAVVPALVAGADLTRPLLAVPVRDERLLVIDGWHRIHRALTDQIPSLPAWILTAEQERHIRLHGD